MGERKFTESQAERIKLFQDVYEGRIPKRVPVEVSVSWEAAIRYSGLELKEAQWNTELYGVSLIRFARNLTRINRRSCPH